MHRKDLQIIKKSTYHFMKIYNYQLTINAIVGDNQENIRNRLRDSQQNNAGNEENER